MSNLPAFTSPTYCTDEDIAVRAGGDFATLTPNWQQMAAAADGVLSIGPPWSLSSATVNFAANGVAPNHVVQFTGPKSAFPGGGALLAVDTVVGNVVTLRRLHKDVGVGQPPCAAAGLTGVTFLIATLDPQIEEASWDVKSRFGVDEAIVDRTSSWMYDVRDLRMAAVLTVLAQRYVSEARGERGDFPRKVKIVQAQLDIVLARVQIRWGPTVGALEEPTTLFDCKISR